MGNVPVLQSQCPAMLKDGGLRKPNSRDRMGPGKRGARPGREDDDIAFVTSEEKKLFFVVVDVREAHVVWFSLRAVYQKLGLGIVTAPRTAKHMRNQTRKGKKNPTINY
jgi:ribosomal protein L16/L10AE